MAINPYAEMQKVYNAKIAWGNATTDEERAKQSDIANKARTTLSNYGYKDLADKISADGATAETVKRVMDGYAKTNKVATRPYLYSLGQKYGMSSSDIDKIISWDDDTGQVSLGGRVVGTPDIVVDGVSYWSDPSKLDKAFDSHIAATGTTRPKETTVNQENEKLFKSLYGEYDHLVKTNPFETETGKSILAKYDLAGLQGRDNEVANGASSNGGNIDSFAAANALRQQTSLVNQGQMAVLEAHQQKLDHARSLLSDIGVHIDRVYNQDETSKNNDVTRKSEIASVTGHTPTEWTLQNDAFLKNFVDESGNLKPEYYETNFQELINNAKASGNSDLANKYAILRGLKIFGKFSEYGKYIDQGDISYITPQKTEDAKNNEFTRKAETATVTGYTPTEWTYASNPYFNSDGTLNDVYMSEDFDNTGGFTTIINNAKERIKTTNDSTERDNLEATIKYATQAKAYKTLNNPEYAQYAHEVSGVIPQKTETAREFDDTMTYNYALIESDENKNNANNATSLALVDKEGANAVSKINAQKNADVAVAKATAKTNENKDSGDDKKDDVLTDSEVKNWADKLNSEFEKEFPGWKALKSTSDGNYTLDKAETAYVVLRVFGSDDLTQEQKEYLVYDKFKLNPDAVNDVVNDKHYK